MDISEGMMAVVRGLPDAALTVSLLDGNRQYTLVPNNVQKSVPAYVQVIQKPVPVKCASTEVSQEIKHRKPLCQSGTQAVDGRYTSVYQTSHCNVQPTSPPVQLTEFPPQRAELYPGHGNFEVGGPGSGETSFSPTRTNGSFKGAMNWPERGAVYSPRSSYEPDAFALSLRKYPALSPERSSEIVEHLINYTHKNIKNQQRSPGASQSSNNSNPIYDRRISIDSSLKLHGTYHSDAYENHDVQHESPTRDLSRNNDRHPFEYNKSLFGRNCDVRYLMDLNKRVNEAVRNGSNYPYPYSTINEGSEYMSQAENHADILNNTNSIHTETQVEISKVSREVATVPREKPSIRNVAVPLSPISSLNNYAKELNVKCSDKSIQTSKPVDLALNVRKSVQTCLSSIDILREQKIKCDSGRKTKSQEELNFNSDIEEELVLLANDLSKSADTDIVFTRNALLKILRKLHKTDQAKIKLAKYIIDHLYSEINFKNFTKQLSNKFMYKIKKHGILKFNPTTVFRAEITQRNSVKIAVDNLIKTWLDDIPIKSVDYFGRKVDKEKIRHTVSNKIKPIIGNKNVRVSDKSLKPEIFDIIENMPVDIDPRNKRYYFKRIINDLIVKIDNVCFDNTTDRKKWVRKGNTEKEKENNFVTESLLCQYVQPTEDELKKFIQDELDNFTAKFQLKVCTCTTREIEIELIDILIDSIEAIRYGNEEQVRNEILILISDLIQISQQEAIYFSTTVIQNFKNTFLGKNIGSIPSQTYTVLQNSVQNVSMQTQNTNDFSIEAITDQDIQNNLDSYTQQIVNEINEWMANIQDLNETDMGFKQVVAHDLAGDIVDRHKYLELNPNSKKSDADELEHLKYQIFKWVNKLVKEDNYETIRQAPKLMQKIQNIPIPMLTKPVQHIDTNIPLCCQNISKRNDAQNEKRRITNSGDKLPIEAGCSKYIKNEKRSESSPSGVSDGIMAKCGSLQETNNNNNNNNINIKTDSTLQHIKMEPPASTQKSQFIHKFQSKHSQPQYKNVSMIDSPTVKVENRRFSEPVTLPSNITSGTPTQTPNFDLNYTRGGIPSTQLPNLAQATSSKSVNKPSCCYLKPPNTNTVPTIQQLNEEYDEFVKNWVQQVPIHLPKPQDQELEDKLRLGLYNGIWKAIIKIKMNPVVFTNSFYYQDLLDDEIDDLLSCLPSNPEIDSKKQVLKSKLLEKTTDMTQQIMKTPSSYKQQLVDNVSINIPKVFVDIAGQDVNKHCEDIHKIILAEDFIMFTMYKDHDKVKASVYKKKLMKHVQEFIDVIKKIYGKELKDIEMYAFRDEILNALNKVPVPSDDTMREECNEILLGLEIEQWFADLPLHATNDYYEILSRKRYVSTLAKKIHDMEKQSDLNYYEDVLRREITKFIARLPLREGAVGNTQFMVDELINRLRNRPKETIIESGPRKKSVSFVDPNSYDDFRRNMQICSSFSDASNANKAQENQRSFMVVRGDRADDASYLHNEQQSQNNQPQSPQEWFSLHEDVAPQIMFSGMRPPYSGKLTVPQMLTDTHTAQTKSPQCSMACQAPDPLHIHDDPWGHDQIIQGSSCREPMNQQHIMPGEQFIAGDNSFRQPVPSTSREPESYHDRQPSVVCHDYLPSTPDQYFRNYSPRRSPSPNKYIPEGSSRPFGSYGSLFQQPTDMRQFTQKNNNTLHNPRGFIRQPIGFSTPLEYVSPQRESRPKKKARDIDRNKLETARRRLDLEGSDDEDANEEMRCRCMERVWRTCRKKRPIFCDDYDMAFPPCLPMRYPFFYYF